MNEIAEAYIKFLSCFKTVNKPLMPKFDVHAYTESEYLNAIYSINKELEKIDDLNLTIQFLKGY